MKSVLLGSALACFFSCGGNSEPAHHYPQSMSAEQHAARADYHEQEATQVLGKVKPDDEIHRARCVAPGSTLESGGERMQIMSPCWTLTEENAAYTRLAEQQKRAAEEHRDWAKALKELETNACRHLSEKEQQTSPFQHPRDVLVVEPYKENGVLRGVHVVFKKIPNLNKGWLSRSVACHRARAAKVGYSRDWMPHCPLALPETTVDISEEDRSLEVVLRSTNGIVAGEILGRTMHLREIETTNVKKK